MYNVQVFYDAKDAVAFCLQAQQMLSMQQWPSPKETSSEEQATSLMSSYVNPIGDLFLQNKSRSTHSTYSLLNPLSSSRFSSKHQSMNQGTHCNKRVYSLEAGAQRLCFHVDIRRAQAPLPTGPLICSISAWPENEDHFNCDPHALAPCTGIPTSPFFQVQLLCSSSHCLAWIRDSFKCGFHECPNLSHTPCTATSVGIDIQVRMGLASGFLYPGESLHGHPTIELARGGCCRKHKERCSHTRCQQEKKCAGGHVGREFEKKVCGGRKGAMAWLCIALFQVQSVC
eukprot:560411-Pelagomonas_calceolata.AAC.3